MPSKTDHVGFSIDAHELKALSVPTSLLFMLGAEYDMFLTCSGGPMKLRFPMLAPNYRRLLSNCAQRFALDCVHDATSSLVSGTPRIPVLRYADFLPGRLHVDELLAIFSVKPATAAKLQGGEYIASFIPYDEYTNDEALADVHGLGYYLTIEYGLALATHGHLVRFIVRPGCNPTQATLRFQRFSGWQKFDLRFDDSTKMAGVVVMPSVHDAFDLFERYEDEDSDDEDDCLPFSLRPIASHVSVPYMEDAQLRRLRSLHWNRVVEFWDRFPKTRNTVVVSNLFEKAKLDDIVKMFEGLAVVQASMVLDDSPLKRQRAFITFATTEDTKNAMAFDGKNTHGKALRVQISPPYIDETRRGRPAREGSVSPSPQPTPQRGVSPDQRSHQKPPASASPGASAATPSAAAASASPATDKKKEDGRRKGAAASADKSAATATTASPAADKPQAATAEKPPAKAAGAKEQRSTGAKAQPQPQVQAKQAPAAPEPPAPAGGRSPIQSAPPAQTPLSPSASLAPSPAGSAQPTTNVLHQDPDRLAKVPGMNIAAKEFVPRFSPQLASVRPPPPYGGVSSPLPLPLPPPPPPPPAYQMSPPAYPGTSPVFPPMVSPMMTNSPTLSGSFGHPPPAYHLPPGPPPGYVTTPTSASAGRGADVPPPLYMPPPPPFGAVPFGMPPPPPHPAQMRGGNLGGPMPATGKKF